MCGFNYNIFLLFPKLKLKSCFFLIYILVPQTKCLECKAVNDRLPLLNQYIVCQFLPFITTLRGGGFNSSNALKTIWYDCHGSKITCTNSKDLVLMWKWGIRGKLWKSEWKICPSLCCHATPHPLAYAADADNRLKWASATFLDSGLGLRRAWAAGFSRNRKIAQS